jgi:predicted translation initiation factor SUI1
MTKPSRKILFVASDEADAKAACDSFAAASARLSLPWTASYRGGGSALADIAGVAVLVAVGLPTIEAGAAVRIEHITPGSDIVQAVNGLIARLLGGSDAPLPPKPPPPAPPKKVHTVKVSRETAGRRGKGVTVISELPLGEDALRDLATQLKNKCGTGGTAKDGRIEIQGDHRDRLVIELEKLGYKVKRAGG